MKSVMIRLSTINDVRNFVNIMAKVDIDVDLECGRYIVDAKSIMGIFSLDLMNPIKLTAHTENSVTLDELLKEIEPFIEK